MRTPSSTVTSRTRLKTIPILTGTAEKFVTSGSAAIGPPRIGGGLFPGAPIIEGAGISTAARAFPPDWRNRYSSTGRSIRPIPGVGSSTTWFIDTRTASGHGKSGTSPDFDLFWSGSNAEYVRLLKVGYLAAKAADPTTTVLFGGMAYWEDQGFLPEVLDLIVSDPDAAANGFFFDVLPIHLYANPYHIKNLAPWAKDQMTARGIFWKAGLGQRDQYSAM